jgi:two-component system phosphate regulon response regulator OmpR
MEAQTKSKILVVDDDNKLRKLLSEYLMQNDFSVISAENAFKAREAMAHEQFDLLIVDVMMPGETGFKFTENIRKVSDTPILMLTAKDDTESRIEGLELGADDYLVKPFEPKELLLRAKKLISRYPAKVAAEKGSAMLEFGNYIFDFASRTLKVKNIDSGLFETIPLSSKELELLYLFCKNVNSPISRLDISTVFNGISERSVDVQVARLRKKIELDPHNPRHIHTHWGIGYVFKV